MKSVSVVLSVVLALSGCRDERFDRTAEVAAAAPMIVPDDYRSQIAATVVKLARDPASIRDLEATAPKPTFMGAGTRIASCVRFNARNGFGGFTGKRTYIAVFLEGKLSGFDLDETFICGATTGYSKI